MRARPFLIVISAAVLAACGGGDIVGSDDGGDIVSDSSVATTVASVAPTTTTTFAPGPTVASETTEATSTTTTTSPATPTPQAVPAAPPTSIGHDREVPSDLIGRVLDDASDRLGTDAIEVAVAEAVEWPDGALGCPEPGVLYTQATTPGYHVVVSGGGATLDYRLTSDGSFRICDRPTASPRDGDS